MAQGSLTLAAQAATRPMPSLSRSWCGETFSTVRPPTASWNGVLAPLPFSCSATSRRAAAIRDTEARSTVPLSAAAPCPSRKERPAAEVWINPPNNRPTVRTLELPRDTHFVPQLSQSH